MRMKRKSYVFSAVVLIVLIAALVFSFAFSKRNETPETADAVSETASEEKKETEEKTAESEETAEYTASRFAQTEEETSSDDVESETQPQGCDVLFYGDMRIGAVEGSFDLSCFEKELSARFAQGITPDCALLIKEEETTEEALPQERLLETVGALVGSETTDGYGLVCGDEVIGVVKKSETAREAISDFLAIAAESRPEQTEVRLPETALLPVTVEKSKVADRSDLAALLGLCTDEETNILSVDYADLARYYEAGEIPHIEITEVYVKRITEQVIIEPETRYVYSDTENVTYEKILSPGKQGVKKVVYVEESEDGETVKRYIESSEIIRDAIDRVIEKGTITKGVATGKFIWTTDEGYISSLFGRRYLFDEWGYHYGIDIAIDTGTPLYAGDGGVVVNACDNGNGYGTYVVIDHGNGFETYYGHMSKVAVKAGQPVSKGQLIGWSGATGRVTGPHVHYEIRYYGERVNPLDYLPKR